MIVFVAGLPRSGSSLLMGLLAQNPRHHATPTNGLCDMVQAVRDNWTTVDAFRSQGLERVRPHIESMIRHMVVGYHHDAIGAGRMVFDKGRGWVAAIETLEAAFGDRVKIIYPIRDVRSIVASFEGLYRRNPMTRPAYPLAPQDGLTVEGRVRQLMGPGTALSLPIDALREAIHRGFSDRLLLVPYRDLTGDPIGTLRAIHDAVGSPWFGGYDPKNVQQAAAENDDVWGFPDLHRVAPSVAPERDAPWEGVLPERVAAALHEQYADIQRLAGA